MTSDAHPKTAAPDEFRAGPSTTGNQPAPGACCGGAAPAGTDACCARDAEIKSSGGSGCGCGSTPAAPASKKTGCCG
jgi:hypothetical protein